MRVSAAIAIATIAGCALSHEISVDANADTAVPRGLLAPCPGSMAGLNRDCGWTVAATFGCRPGSFVAVGCDAACGLGSCSDDSMIRVCAGTSPCGADTAIGADDDDPMCGGGVCSIVPQVSCPASGQITVLTAPFSSGTPYACNVAVR